jgi:hypothetical protein
MREKLNSNPILQVALIGVLLIGTGFFVMSSMGGGEEEPSGEADATVAVESPTGSEPAPEEASASGAVSLPPVAATAAPPPPGPVVDAFNANRTVVLLFVKEGAIDDKLVVDSVGRLSGFSDVSTFVVPASRIARYAAITQGVAVDRVPALVVVRPKKLTNGVPSASVSYGFQSPESVSQAVIDAGYRGKTLDYHP